MKPLRLHQTLPVMTDIGSVSQIGATVINGNPQASSAMIYGQPEDTLSCGFFGCTRGAFSMTYPFTEHATVLEGHVRLTDETTGITTEYRPGDSWFVEQGTVVRWEITSSRFVKHYLASVAK